MITEVGDNLEVDPLKELAGVCEQMNLFAQSLRRENKFVEVATSTDLRLHGEIGVFDKFVEATLNVGTGETAVWAMEFSSLADGWRVHTNTSISYGDYDEEVGTVMIPKDGSLGKGLKDAVSSLVATYSGSKNFRQEIERILAK